MDDINAIGPDEITNIPTMRAAYSDRTALLMAKFAKRVYDQFEKDDDSWAAFQKVFSPLGFDVFEKLVDPDTGTAGIVLAHPDHMIVVVFRGTENLPDWITNLRFGWEQLQGEVRVHRGFFGSYKLIRDAMNAKVIELLHAKRRPVYITGHSLGGALAVMATAELANHEDEYVRDAIAACYTFGCPKAGDRLFDQYVKVPLYRITNGVDIVPALPPVLSGYKHAGDTRYFGALGIPPDRRPPNIVRKLWFTTWGLLRLPRTRRVASIGDHAMTVYVSKLDTWVKTATAKGKERRKRKPSPAESLRFR